MSAASPERRAARARVVALAAAALLAVEANYLAARHTVRWDWTAAGVYTLSEPTVEALARLDQDVVITSFLDPGLPAYETVREVLERYRAASSRVAVEHVDRATDPARARALLQRYDLAPEEAFYRLAVSSGGRDRIVDLDEVVDTGGRSEVVLFRGEAVLTGAILALQRDAAPRVYLVSGHEEMSREAGGFRGLGTFLRTIERSGVEVRPLDLAREGAVPASAAAVIVAGPLIPWPPAEVAALARYLERGGRALVLAPPLPSTDPPGLRRSGLEDLLARFGVRAEDAVLVDAQPRGVVVPDEASGRFVTIVASPAVPVAGHPVVKNVASLATLLSEQTRPVRAAEALPPGMRATSLLESVATAHGETDIASLILLGKVSRDEKDLAGPVSVAVAVEGRLGGADGGHDAVAATSDVQGAAAEAAGEDAGDAGGDAAPEAGRTRLVVVGSAELASDAFLRIARNDRLLLNAVSWLVGDTRALGIEPRDVGQIPLYLDGQQLFATFLVLVLIIPGLVLTGGVVVWAARRRDAASP